MNVIQAFGCKDKELFVIIQILENKKTLQMKYTCSASDNGTPNRIPIGILVVILW